MHDPPPVYYDTLPGRWGRDEGEGRGKERGVGGRGAWEGEGRGRERGGEGGDVATNGHCHARRRLGRCRRWRPAGGRGSLWVVWGQLAVVDIWLSNNQITGR